MKRDLSIKIKRADAVSRVIVCSDCSPASLGKVFRSIGAGKKRVCVIYDEGFARARRDVIVSIAKVFPRSRNLFVAVKGAESSKSLDVAGDIIGKMIRAGFTRGDLCLAVGGGVVGDLGGFVASLYHRGIDVVQMPTTLLAMVDSSIGGKTAVNHPYGKNLIGAFHQPRAILQVLDFLDTLPENDFLSGLGEVFKYAVGFSPELFRYLDKNSKAVLSRNPDALAKILLHSVAIKARIVSADERETGLGGKNDRRMLNLGHTLGHGIEKAYGVPHGMAVAVGVTMSARLSRKLGLCDERCYTQVMSLARKLKLKTERDIRWKLSELLPYVKRDKKVADGKVQFICLEAVGRATVRPLDFSRFKLLEEKR